MSGVTTKATRSTQMCPSFIHFDESLARKKGGWPHSPRGQEEVLTIQELDEATLGTKALRKPQNPKEVLSDSKRSDTSTRFRTETQLEATDGEDTEVRPATEFLFVL